MKTILLVEDEPVIAQLAQVILEGEGYRVAHVGNGREALDRLDEARPDLILTDNMMPLMDGTSFCREVRERSEYGSVPIIMMSAGRKPPGIDALINAFLAKPFVMDELLGIVTSTLDDRLNGKAGR